MGWKPELTPGVDLRKLPLSPLHGFVLSRVDGASDVTALSQVTGMPVDRVEALLDELVATGALRPRPAAEAPPPADDADADDAAVPDEPEPADARQLFEATLREQPPDARVALAKTASEPQLSALCFDPLPVVAQALLENPKVGPVHARLLARHHRTALGLEALAARGHFASDGGVRRNLLQNPMLPQSVYRRLWAMRRLMEQHRVTISRDLPEATRRVAREVLRTRFSSGPPEEKVELIVKTEGRCLAALVGLPVDSKTTSMLCARTYASLQFVQNLARWAAAPPQLIGHLLRQDLVKRNAMLRDLLERHPNSPKGNF